MMVRQKIPVDSLLMLEETDAILHGCLSKTQVLWSSDHESQRSWTRPFPRSLAQMKQLLGLNLAEFAVAM